MGIVAWVFVWICWGLMAWVCCLDCQWVEQLISRSRAGLTKGCANLFMHMEALSAVRGGWG